MSRLLLVKSLVLVLLSLVVLGGCGGSGGVDSEHDLVPAQETHVTDTNTTPDTNGTQPDTNGTGGGSDDSNATGGGGDTNTTAPTIRLSTLKLAAADTTLPKDHNTTLTLTATYSDHTTKPLTGGITWIVTPKEAVTLHGTTLTALEDVNVTVQAKVGTTLSNTVNLNIYWEVNGHRLPPEPDPKVNNATLLGIDINSNGVRDDLERWIIKKYAKSDYPKHKTEVGLQWGRVVQQIIQSPKTAYEDKKYLLIDKAQECRYRTYEKLGKSLNYGIDNKIFNDEYVKKAFNTKERIKAYYIFNGSMGGHVFGDPYFEKPCDFDLAELKE